MMHVLYDSNMHVPVRAPHMYMYLQQASSRPKGWAARSLCCIGRAREHGHVEGPHPGAVTAFISR